MLYKKNVSDELSSELFQHPSSEYRGAPFWSWNCKMTPDILKKQIEYLKSMGFGGFHMHSRSGMDNKYLGSEFMNLICSCVEKAKQENMLAWLYDEDRWPSGFAGGFVTKEPRYRARILYFLPSELICETICRGFEDRSKITSLDELVSKEEAILKGLPYYLASYDIVLDKDGNLQSYSSIEKDDTPIGSKWVAICTTQKPDDWYNGYCYVDTLSSDAIQRFIEITHETYKKWVGNEFDKAIPSIFTDEPQFSEGKNLSYPTDKTPCILPWTNDLQDSFMNAYQENLLEKLPELFWDLPDEKISSVRYHFHDHVCNRFTEAFSALCGKWCDQNGIQLTGHMLEEPTLQSQTARVGEAMRAYKYFGYPGIDMLCNHVELTTAKQTQSVVNQYGKEGMMSELYGVTNWDFDFRGHKFQGDWQAALGVSIRVPHLSWVSMKGDAKRDYPASINYQSPWYKEYKIIEDHFSRVNTALTRGTAHVKIGVIHPIESYWLHWGPQKTTLAKRIQLDKNFDDFIHWMLLGQLDFDYISESLFPEECLAADNPLPVGRMKYETIIVPGMQTIRSTTLERLNEFQKKGGKLVFLGECPTLVDAKPSDAVKSLFEKSICIPFERYSLLSALEEDREVEIRLDNGDLTGDLIYRMRDDIKNKWLFIAHAKPYTQADIAPATHIQIKLKGTYTPLLYNTLTGEIEKISFEVKDGFTYLSQTIYLHDSILLSLTPNEKQVKYASEPFKETILEKIDYRKKVPFKRTEDNVLLLDLAEYKIDDELEFSSLEEIRRIDEIVRKKANIPPKSRKQPWCLPDETPTHTETLKFEVVSDVQIDGAQLALEDASIAEIRWDNTPVENHIVGYYVDESIQKIPLPSITVGKHILTIKLPLGSRTYTENCYLLGDFSVKVEGTDKTLCAPTNLIGFGSITTQGLPFYGGNILYQCEITVPKDGNTIRIHSSLYRGALISVRVDGKEKGNIIFAPYNLTIPNITPEKHMVELCLFGNRYNTFAALHDTNQKNKWEGPSMWITKGDEFTYSYRLRETGILSSPTIEIIHK